MILKTELLEKIQDCKETISDIEKDIEIYLDMFLLLESLYTFNF